jgi:hypothetical protein
MKDKKSIFYKQSGQVAFWSMILISGVQTAMHLLALIGAVGLGFGTSHWPTASKLFFFLIILATLAVNWTCIFALDRTAKSANRIQIAFVWILLTLLLVQSPFVGKLSAHYMSQ